MEGVEVSRSWKENPNTMGHPRREDLAQECSVFQWPKIARTKESSKQSFLLLRSYLPSWILISHLYMIHVLYPYIYFKRNVKDSIT